MKRTVEIEDSLDERVEYAKDALKERFDEFASSKPRDFNNWNRECDVISEIADSNTPVYYSEIDGLYFLYGDMLDEAYERAGIGRGDEDNHKQVAIYCYIEQELWRYLGTLRKEYEERCDEEL